MALLHPLPYLLLIAANLIYLHAHGFKPIYYHPRLLLYNLAFFLLLALPIFFKLSALLHRSFAKGEGGLREQARLRLQEALRLAETVRGYFRPGNLHNLVYVGVW